MTAGKTKRGGAPPEVLFSEPVSAGELPDGLNRQEDNRGRFQATNQSTAGHVVASSPV